MAHSVRIAMIFIVLGIVQFYLGVQVTKIAYREFKKYKNDNNKKQKTKPLDWDIYHARNVCMFGNPSNYKIDKASECRQHRKQYIRILDVDHLDFSNNSVCKTYY